MGEIKKFVTKPREAPKDRGRVETDVDGFTVVALEPSDYVMSQLIASASRMARFPEQMAGALGFLDDVLEPSSTTYLTSRLKDWADPYDVPDLIDLMRYLVDEFTDIKKARDGNREERRAAGGKRAAKAVRGGKVIDGETVGSGR